MDVGKIESILRGIGAEKVRVVSSDRVTCACPLAQWTHSKGRDNRPSFVVFAEGKHGDPIYACQACHDQGSLRDLLLFLWTKGRDTYHWIEVVDEGAPVEKARKVSEKLLEAHENQSSVQGFVTNRIEPPPVVESVASDGRPFYDYKLLAEADAVPEIPWSEYAPYVGSVPKYALERGLTMETCKEWELGHDREGKRLLFPIRDRRGRLVAISGRLYATTCLRCGGEWVTLCSECGNDEAWHVDGALCETWLPARSTCERCGTPEPPKYLHRKGFKRNLLLYGEHRQEETDGRVYVVEGNLDMIMMWQAGYRPVVALFGSGVGEPQVEKLIARWGQGHIINVPDGNEAGYSMAAQLKKMIAGRARFTWKKILVKDADVGGMTPDELHELLGPPPCRIAA